MVDKVVRLNDSEAIIIYTNRTPVRLTETGNIDKLMQWFLDDKIVIRYDEYTQATNMRGDTQIIKVA